MLQKIFSFVFLNTAFVEASVVPPEDGKTLPLYTSPSNYYLYEIILPFWALRG
jgi:hypothetical protein